MKSSASRHASSVRCPRCGFFYKPNHQNLAVVRAAYPRVNTPWSPDDDETLEAAVKKGVSIREIAATLQRPPTAINRRIDVLRIAVSREEPTHPTHADDLAVERHALEELSRPKRAGSRRARA